MTDIERVATRISMGELERRWAAVRREMGTHGIDALVMQNASDWLGGYVKWFTDLPATNGYPRSVIFHAADLMTVVDMGPHGGRRNLDGKHGRDDAEDHPSHPPVFAARRLAGGCPHAGQVELADGCVVRHVI